jgi:hypothetical protein
MGPAKLVSLDPRIALEPVADDHLLGVGPQHLFCDIGPPRRGDHEDRRQAGHRRPEPHLVPALPPRRLVDVGHGGLADMIPEFLDRGLQLGGGLPLQSADHPDGDRQAQQVEGQLADRALAQAVAPGQDAEDRPKPRAERPGGHARRQGRTGRGAAAGAHQAMEPVFIHRRPDRRQLGDLVSDRFGVVAVQLLVAPTAFRRLAVDDLAKLLGWYEWSSLAMMAGLATPLLARGGDRRPPLDRRGIGGGWPGGVGGVLVEPLFQVGDPPLEGLHQYRHRRLRLGRELIPDGLR